MFQSGDARAATTTTVTTVRFNNASTTSTVSTAIPMVVINNNYVPDPAYTNPGVINNVYTESPISRGNIFSTR